MSAQKQIQYVDLDNQRVLQKARSVCIEHFSEYADGKAINSAAKYASWIKQLKKRLEAIAGRENLCACLETYSPEDAIDDDIRAPLTWISVLYGSEDEERRWVTTTLNPEYMTAESKRKNISYGCVLLNSKGCEDIIKLYSELENVYSHIKDLFIVAKVSKKSKERQVTSQGDSPGLSSVRAAEEGVPPRNGHYCTLRAGFVQAHG